MLKNLRKKLGQTIEELEDERIAERVSDLETVAINVAPPTRAGAALR